MAVRIGEAVKGPTDPIIAHALQAAAAHSGVPLALLTSVAYHESGYKPHAVNASSGAAGLMQLMPATAAGLGVDPYNPVAAAQAGAHLLRTWRDRFDSWAAALAAYNWGPSRVERARHSDTNVWPQGVRDYVMRVLEGAGMPVPFVWKMNGEAR